MKQIWRLNALEGSTPLTEVAMILLRNGTIFQTEPFSAASRYSWDSDLWKKYGNGCDIIAYHYKGEYK